VSKQVRVLRKDLPTLLAQVEQVPDPKDPRERRHKLTSLLLYGLLMFVSRRETNREMSLPPVNRQPPAAVSGNRNPAKRRQKSKPCQTPTPFFGCCATSTLTRPLSQRPCSGAGEGADNVSPGSTISTVRKGSGLPLRACLLPSTGMPCRGISCAWRMSSIHWRASRDRYGSCIRNLACAAPSPSSEIPVLFPGSIVRGCAGSSPNPFDCNSTPGDPKNHLSTRSSRTPYHPRGQNAGFRQTGPLRQRPANGSASAASWVRAASQGARLTPFDRRSYTRRGGAGMSLLQILQRIALAPPYLRQFLAKFLPNSCFHLF